MSDALLHLLSTDGLGSKSFMGLLAGEGALSAEQLLSMPEQSLKAYCRERIGDGALATKAVSCLLRSRKTKPVCTGEALRKKDISYVTWNDKNYPKRLRGIPDPPFVLYCKGSLPSDDRPAVAIVGSRMPSVYGRNEAIRFAGELASLGFQIISGMARGIDGIAGREALLAGKNASFAVLGSGVDICYPKENRPLYDRLMEEGGILSEYRPGTEPRAALFPPRNRIISALADALLVVEAKARSGTMITVDMALEQGKDVFAVPGRNNDATSAGCNSLIAQGAQIAISPAQFLECYMPVRRKENDNNVTNTPAPCMDSPLENALYEILSAQEVKGTDLLQEEAERELKTELTAGEISSALLNLQLKHLITEEGVGFYRRE